MTEKLRQEHVNAKTSQDRLKAKQAWVANLKRRYSGIDVSATGPAASEHLARFSRLLREWNPINCSLEDLKSIAGQPTTESSGFVEYKFDTGEVVTVWRFTVCGSRIQGIQYIMGE